MVRLSGSVGADPAAALLSSATTKTPGLAPSATKMGGGFLPVNALRARFRARLESWLTNSCAALFGEPVLFFFLSQARATKGTSAWRQPQSIGSGAVGRGDLDTPALLTPCSDLLPERASASSRGTLLSPASRSGAGFWTSANSGKCLIRPSFEQRPLCRGMIAKSRPGPRAGKAAAAKGQHATDNRNVPEPFSSVLAKTVLRYTHQLGQSGAHLIVNVSGNTLYRRRSKRNTAIHVGSCSVSASGNGLMMFSMTTKAMTWGLHAGETPTPLFTEPVAAIRSECSWHAVGLMAADGGDQAQHHSL